MSVPFGPNEQEPYKDGHPELLLSPEHTMLISARCDEVASQLARDIQHVKVSGKIERESRYNSDFCEIAKAIGAMAYPHPTPFTRTVRAEAIEHGMIIGHVFGGLMSSSGKVLPSVQLESAQTLHRSFARQNIWGDYSKWISPPTGTLQEHAVAKLRHHGIAPARYLADDETESLFYNSAGLYAANGIALFIARTSS